MTSGWAWDPRRTDPGHEYDEMDRWLNPDLPGPADADPPDDGPPAARPAAGDGDRWAEAALLDETAAVRMTPEGARNDRLNVAAFNLGQIVAGGHLAENRVRDALLQAARAAGLGRTESEATVTSGLRAGAQHPREPREDRLGRDTPPARAAGREVVETEPFEEDPDPEAAFVSDVAREAYRIRVREAAREKVDADRAPPAPPFDSGFLKELLDRPEEPPFRVHELIPWDSTTVVVAQRKTGKTSLNLCLARSLLQGGLFLEAFEVRPLDGAVALLNFEVSGRQIATWADEARVPADRLWIVNLRGRRNPLGNDDDKAALAEQLKGHDVETLIVDPFGRAYTGQSQNDPGEVGAWLAELDRWARSDVGATDLVLSVHAGWDGERTRGASSIEDWADTIFNLTKDDDGNRFFRAMGRDVDQPEDELEWRQSDRSLRLTGHGGRRASGENREIEKLVPFVVQFVEDHPGAGVKEIKLGLGGNGARVGNAIDTAVARGLVEVTIGKYGKHQHKAVPSGSGTAENTEQPE